MPELTKLQKLWIENGFIEIDQEKNKIVYKNLKKWDKKYKFSDPEEQVRSNYFVELTSSNIFEFRNCSKSN